MGFAEFDEKNTITRITENRDRFQKGAFSWKFALCWCQPQPRRRWPTTAGSTLFLHQQEFLLRVGVCCGTIMKFGFKGFCQKSKCQRDCFRRCHHTDHRILTPQTPAWTRLLWTASVDFAKRTALHASTLVRWYGIPILQRYVVLGVKGIMGISTEYLVQTKPAWAVSQEYGLLSLLAVNSTTLSGVPYLWCVNMEDDTPFVLVSAFVTSSSTRKRSSHRRARANLYCCCLGVFTVLSVQQCCCEHQPHTMKQRTHHHVRWNGCRSPGMYARHTGCSFWVVIVAARVNIVSSPKVALNYA